MTLQLLHSEFPYLLGIFSFLFNQCAFILCVSNRALSTGFLKHTCFLTTTKNYVLRRRKLVGREWLTWTGCTGRARTSGRRGSSCRRRRWGTRDSRKDDFTSLLHLKTCIVQRALSPIWKVTILHLKLAFDCVAYFMYNYSSRNLKMCISYF